jgi:hypothetical protein
MAGLSARRTPSKWRRRRRENITVIPIRASSGEGSKNLADRMIEMTRGLGTAAILKQIDELRLELRCVEDAITNLELLAVSRSPQHPEPVPGWKGLPSANRN